MALGTELFSLATSFDPYGAMRKGQMAPQAYDVEQQKLDLEQQKMGLQKLQLAEQQKELQGEQGKPPELATMAQNVLGAQFKLNDDTGLPTVAGQMNTFLLQGKQEAAQGQKLLQQAQFETDPKNKASLISEGRRLLNNAVKYQGDAKKLAQTEQNNLLYGLSTATNQTEWDNTVKGWDNSGLPLPKGFPTEYSPDNQKKISATAPLDVQQKIQTELRKREDDKRKEQADLRAEKRDVLAERRDIRAERREQRLEAKLDSGVTQKMTSEQARAQRTINALGSIASSLEPIQEFEIGTNVGMLPSLTTKDGMLNAVRNYAGRSVTKESADQLNTVFLGIGRNLAAIETSGLATGLAELSKSLQTGVYIQPGKDDAYSVAMKLADIKRISKENIQPAIDAGAITKDQAATAQKLIDKIEDLVPYSTTDVVRATRKAKGTGKPTIGEATKKAIMPSEIKPEESDLINKYLTPKVK